MSEEDTPTVKKLPAGTRIGYYEVVERVGSGGFGTLYKARRGKATFAVKLSTKALREMNDEERKETELRVGREVAALHTLRHPNVVRVHAHETWPDQDGYPYIVMDFVDGYRLYDWRRSLKPSLRLCCQVISKIALALNQMHQLGVYHRDLKSENVLVQRDGEPVIVDFGIARRVASETVTQVRTWLGTPRYLSPEYVKYWDTSDFAKGVPFAWAPTTDLYAVGVMFYELVSGRPPVRGPSEAEVLLAIKYTTPEAPHEVNPGLPASVGGIIMKLLEKEPSKRVQSGQELFDLLVAAAAAAPGHVAAWDNPLEMPVDPAAALAPPALVPVGPVPALDGGLPGTVKARQGPGAAPNAAKARAAPRQESFVETKNLVAAAAAAGMAPEPGDATPRMGTPGTAGQPAGEVAVDGALNGAGPVRGSAAPAPAGLGPGPLPFHEPTQNKGPPVSSELRSVHGSHATAGKPKTDSTSELHREARALAGASAPKRAPRWPILLGAGVLLLVIIVLALASREPRKPAGPVSLLAQVQQDEAARKDAGLDVAGMTAQTAGAMHRASPLEGVQGEGVRADAPARASDTGQGIAPEPPVAKAPESGGGRRLETHRAIGSNNGSNNLDEADIRRLEKEAYASKGGRPVLPGPGSGSGGKKASSSGPAWMQVAERVDTPATPSTSFGIPLGAHIKAKLVTNLDSKTASEGPVEARLARPFALKGEVRLPTGTMVYGKASASQGRFSIHFTRMVLPGGREVPLDGLAYDIAEKKAGLKATRGPATPKPKQDSKPARVLKETGQVLAGAIGQGDIGTEAAQRAAQETLSDDGPSTSTSEGASYLDSGTDIEIFVSQAL